MKRKKAAHPLLLLIQKGSYNSRKSEFLRQKSKEGSQTASPTDDSPAKYCELNDCTCCHVSSPPDDRSVNTYSPTTSEKYTGSWVDKVTTLRRLSSCLSQPSELDRRPSLSMSSLSRFSSSYTSWTRPLAGQDNTDSLIPCSDILEDEDNMNDAMNISLEVSKYRRKSSADTYKDIDDIEDFELDDVCDCFFYDEDYQVFDVEEPLQQDKEK